MEGRRGIIHRVHKDGDVIRNDHLFEQAQGKGLDALLEIIQADVPVLVELGNVLPGLDDGAGHQLGEEGDIQRHVHKAFLRANLAPVHIDGIAEGLEGIKADAHRQQDVQAPRPGDAEEGAEGVHEKIEILENAQNHQRHDHAQRDPQLPAVLFIGGGAAIGHHRQAQHQKAAFPVPPAVEHIAGQKQQHMPHFRHRPGQQGLDSFPAGQGHQAADNGEKHRKGQTVECHISPPLPEWFRTQPGQRAGGPRRSYGRCRGRCWQNRRAACADC